MSGHDHAHGTAAGARRGRLAAVLGVTLTVLVAEVVGGLQRCQCLAGHVDVEHSTFQLEPPGHLDHEAVLHD